MTTILKGGWIWAAYCLLDGRCCLAWLRLSKAIRANPPMESVQPHLHVATGPNPHAPLSPYVLDCQSTHVTSLTV